MKMQRSFVHLGVLCTLTTLPTVALAQTNPQHRRHFRKAGRLRGLGLLWGRLRESVAAAAEPSQEDMECGVDANLGIGGGGANIDAEAVQAVPALRR